MTVYFLNTIQHKNITTMVLVRGIVVFIAIFSLAVAQETVPLFAKSEIFDVDGPTLASMNFDYLVHSGDYLVFNIMTNDTDSMMVIYHKNSTSGEFTEVNRIQGTALATSAITANNGWFVTYDGNSREVNFFQLDSNHQVTNKKIWGEDSLSIWFNSFRLMSNNYFVVMDYASTDLSIKIYPYTGGNWAATHSIAFPCPSTDALSLTTDSLALLDIVNSIVSLYTFESTNFTLTDEISLPFTPFATGGNPYAYNGIDALAFVRDTQYVDFLTKIDGQWNHSIVAWNVTESTNLKKTLVSFEGDDLYISVLEYNRPELLQGRLFRFQKSESNVWTNTVEYYQPSPLIDAAFYQTTAAYGFAVTDDTVFALTRSIYTEDATYPAGAQLQFVPTCYADPIELTCIDQAFSSCDPVDISAAYLFTVENPCGAVTVTNHGPTITVTFDSNDKYTTSIEVTRFEQTAQCNVTVRCAVEPTAAPSTVKPPVASPEQVSAATLNARASGALLFVAAALFLV